MTSCLMTNAWLDCAGAPPGDPNPDASTGSSTDPEQPLPPGYVCVVNSLYCLIKSTVRVRLCWVSAEKKKSRVYILLCWSCSGCVLERCEINAVSAILSTGSKWHYLCFHSPVTDGIHLCAHSGGSWGRTVKVDHTMWITTPGLPPGNGRSPCHQGRLRWRVPCCLSSLLSTPFTALLYLYRLILWTGERLHTWGGLKCAFVWIVLRWPQLSGC